VQHLFPASRPNDCLMAIGGVISQSGTVP
jgi:hypothetical protein